MENSKDRESYLPLDLERVSGTHKVPVGSSVSTSSLRHVSFGRLTTGWGAGEFYYLSTKGGMINREEARVLIRDLQEFLSQG